jgi:uncharacterized protein DUF1206
MSGMARSRFIRRATRHDGVRFAARMGYGVSAVLHLLIGYLILRIARGAGGNAHADPSGALETVAETTGGVVALWILAVAIVPLALWRLAEALVGLHPAEGHQPRLNDHSPGNRLKALGLLCVYCGLAATAVRFALGSRESSGQQNAGITARLMQQPWGRGALIVCGATIAVIGAYYAYKGASRRFLADLTDPVGPVITVLGFIGYVAEGLVLCVAGVLVIVAAVDVDPSKATGIDAAVKTLGSTPPGAFLLLFAAAGFAAYGLYSVTLTRYARM